MSKITVATEPRRKRVPKSKQVASKTVGKSILYISARADSEFDLITSFIEELFNRTVLPYPWEKTEIDHTVFRGEDPCLIIMSAPAERWEMSIDDCYSVVRKAFPEVPIFLLTPLNDYEAKSAANDNSITVLNTDTTVEPLYLFIRFIAELTGIEPKVKMTKGKD